MECEAGDMDARFAVGSARCLASGRPREQLAGSRAWSVKLVIWMQDPQWVLPDAWRLAGLGISFQSHRHRFRV